MSKTNCFEVVGQLEFFTESLLNSLIAWCEKNHYDRAYIYHDKDVKHNDDTNEDEPVKNHIHMGIKTGSTKWPFPVLLAHFEKEGLKSTMLQRIRKGWNNYLSYMIHRTEGAVNDGKHLYDASEVHANFDYAKTLETIENEIEEKKAVVDEVIEAILDGRCRRYNYTNFIGGLDYTKKGISERLEKAYKWKETKLLEERKGRKMKVYWICGKSGIGKTTLAKTICENNNWSYAISSSSNDALQDYNGQDCLILDDFRPDGWSKSDVLKMLDNNTSSSIKSRYQNKQTCYLKCIIVTTVKDPLEFWKDGNWSGNKSEDFRQLERRITHLVEMFKEDDNQFARTYFTVKKTGSNGNVTINKYDFTDKLESLRKEEKEEEEEEKKAFGNITCLGPYGSAYGASIVNRGLVDEKDVPF